MEMETLKDHSCYKRLITPRSSVDNCRDDQTITSNNDCSCDEVTKDQNNVK